MKKSLCLIIMVTSIFLAKGQADYVITNGRIIDGTGNSWFRADVVIQQNRIIGVSKGLAAKYPNAKIIDAKNNIVAPGFIDVHAHIEESVFKKPTAENYIYDGVTSVVTGNCGSGADDIARFLQKIDSTKTSINVATLAGHNTIRRLGMGLDNRKATADEMKKMEGLMGKAMSDGAVGLSTGLIYLPGMYSPTEEIVVLSKIAATKGGVYATHMRNEGNRVHEAIDEALTIGREANIPVQISHFKVTGKNNWGRSNETLGMVEEARKQGYDVTIDQYPYTASSTNLAVRLPDWALEGGLDSLRVKMKDPSMRKKILDGMKASQKKDKQKDYSFAVVAWYGPDTTMNGKSITQINIDKGRKKNFINEANLILDMLAKANAQMIYHTMNEKDLVYFMKYPFNMPAADAGISDGTGMPHPRGYGTNARVLARYVREQKVIGLEEAIRRMTSLPATKFNLKDRGLIMEGKYADLLIFDENTIQDKSIYENPHQYTNGIEYVFVNGKPVIENGKHNGTRSGIALRNIQ
ncbi:MAG: N-acyl-D-amino-acid deacylase family protein [Bacteroidota bacterium]|jgi:N-acyl-D-amino-acid deacylase